MLLFIAGIALIYWFFITEKPVYLERHAVMIEHVKKGTLTIQVDAFGTLASAQQQIITSVSAGVVKDIHYKLGSTIEPGATILRLENVDLELEYKRIKQSLAEAQAELLQLNLRQQREVLVERSIISDLEGQLATLSFRHQAQKELANQGIISELSFFETQAQVESLTGQINHAKTRTAQLQQLHQSALTVMKKRVTLTEQELDAMHTKIEQLEVSASDYGVLESLPLELGARILAGAHVATIGDRRALVAQLQVSQSQVGLVKVGQAVNVFAGQEVLQGEVIRIDPVVINHSVNVEVSLPALGDMDLRPKQSVTASIITDTIDNTHYVRTPLTGSGEQTLFLYRVDNNGQTERVPVQLGRQSGQYSEIIRGLKAGDAVVISDLSDYARNKQVVVIH
ncbi:hypothetical protein S4054249_00380 [Pseudoalteromonas luteoviolacea]|uniref:Multidrug resistance protein MdtA-like C-terminal permuted SH3 domain-containing protein n=2 Tax=Pseudoalteromonas luteoviolacea TaxID=43657 RepID=A0A0F6AH56_9GAMM|nr:hypothetical protein S4054249_00380 [Pseudoalteromonas luteoviolacea]AOT11356.1 hypothetical protein S40542_00380 [Pseudoalteromonas luteoviolacea]AOT16269.1 hypothetical protein S4054_00380 [Pseudoalteromonas luteoviolacea]KKE85555.1 hypothetical protein N479_04455 [Pseudoalteromonas luteoviolacea S4054]KZN73039.1 hypothetical protein N481_13375 [Pseudoalteromonas luteoviolacea S4047-1]